MAIDKKKTIVFELLLIIALVICAFFSSKNIPIILAGLTLISALIVSFMLKKRQKTLTNTKQVVKVLTAFALIYLALFYTLGIYTGYYKNAMKLTIINIAKYIVPIIVTIISTEILRDKLLTINSKVSKTLVLIMTVLIEVNLYGYIYDISNLNDFLIMIGFITFSAISSNLLYNYLSPKYGYKPIIVYRLITTLYMYILPIIPDVYVYFRTFFRMIFPLVLYSYIENYYNSDKELVRVQDKRKDNTSIAFTFILLTFLICLVSCKFTYGALVIGSGSMTGNIDKGDVVVFKNENDNLDIGDVIVFKKDNIKVVHRIVKIEYNDDAYQYYTKGDANQNIDDGYITKEDVMGKVKFRIIKIGKPTLWLRDQFK